MSYPGHGYGAPQGFRPQAARVAAPSFAQAQSSFHFPRGPNHIQGELGGSLIPGLGLGVVPSGPTQTPQPLAVPATSPSTQAALSAAEPGTAVRLPGNATDSGSEEGEVSDGEVEDLYEPLEANHGDKNAGISGRLSGDAGVDKSLLTTEQQRQYKMPFELRREVPRERSGSYSPHLSPREIDRADSPPSTIHLDNAESHSRLPPTAPKSLATAKKQAQEAILRLWPLNIRYNNYLEAGIDSALLGNLFKELGLDIPAGTAHSPKGNDVSQAKATPEGGAAKAEPPAAAPPSAPPSKPIDKSEERKDRIARLLAAKGSKTSTLAATNALAPVAATDTVTATAATATVSATDEQPSSLKTEKSKLLQLKMEALKKRREREAFAQSRAHQEAPAGAPLLAKGADQATSGGPVGGIPTAEDRSDPSDQPEVLNQPEKAVPSSIPGLFLSTSQPPCNQESSSSTVPAPSMATTLSKEPRRPFSQNIKSRPFLIHVSDDEDEDVEVNMEFSDGVDSPASRVETPSYAPKWKKGPPLGPARGALNTGSFTPAKSSGQNSGGEDLNSMNKKIEAMKRKIAEAEARKAKRSRPASPATSHPNDNSHDDSADTASTSKAPAESVDGNRTTACSSPKEAAPAHLPAAEIVRLEGAAVGASRSERRIRSRVASERLGLIEARHREQLLKLRALQSQIEKVEREIAESRAEEERLKQDIVASDADEEPHQGTVTPAPLPGQFHQVYDSHDAGHEGLALQPVPGRLMTLPVEEAVPEQASEKQAVDYTASASGMVSSEPSPTAAGNSPDVSGEQSNAASRSSDVSQAEAHADEDFGALETEETPATGPEANAEQAEAIEQDVDMTDANDMPDDTAEDDTDGYEPPDAGMSERDETQRDNQTPATAHGGHAVSTKDEDDGVAVTLIHEQMSRCQPTHEAAIEREVDSTSSQPHLGASNSINKADVTQPPAAALGDSNYTPYQTPLQYFHSYRFHPRFSQCVAGGLRSLTYSNRIDAQKEVCPDQLGGQACPRGEKCQYQHFESMRAADDQILLQLGATGDFDDGAKQRYISGLRQLLTDFRDRKVKDFDTISRGIVEYRARFQGDRSKVLPLGNVPV